MRHLVKSPPPPPPNPLNALRDCLTESACSLALIPSSYILFTLFGVGVYNWYLRECLFVFPVGNWKEILSFRSVGPKCPFSFDKIVLSSSALLRSAYKYNNQIRGGLGRVCATGIYPSIGRVEFSKFQTGILIEWKEPRLSLKFSF